MSEASNQQEVIASHNQTNVVAVQMETDASVPLVNENNANNNPASESNESSPALIFRILAFLSCCSGDNQSITVPRVAEDLANTIEDFMSGVRQYDKNIFGEELAAKGEVWFRQLLSDWDTFLQSVPGVRDTSDTTSSNIKDVINMFIQKQRRGAEWIDDNTAWINRCVQRWNMFLRARAGEKLLTRRNLFFTIVGFMFYIVDMGSDFVTCMYYLHHGQWWQAMATLALVYSAVIFYTGWKRIYGQLHFTGAADWLRYIGASLVNWPDLELYGALCWLEWQLHKSPASSTHLVAEWHYRRANVAFLKYTEGVWEACPQAILQFCLLAPDLYGHWTWSDYLRISGTCVSLCTAGAALVNREKYLRMSSYTDLPLSELVLLLVWAVPVTVSRLLCVTLLVSVHLFWALAGVALHLVLYGVYWCRTKGVPRTPADVLDMCLYTLRFCMSPLNVDGSYIYRHVSHIVHLLVNTVMMGVWILGTPLKRTQPALYIAIMNFHAGMSAVGLVAWQLHENYWRR